MANTKTIQVRNSETLKEIAKLQKKYSLNTATRAIDFAVSEHLGLVEEIKRLEKELRETKDYLNKMKIVFQQKIDINN